MFISGYTAALSLASRGWSGYLDSLFDHAIRNYTVEHIGNWTHGPPVPEYPDLPAIGIILVVMVMASIGVNISTTVNLILTIVSGCLLIFISIIGFMYADLGNWTKQDGGFFAHGLNGVLKASAACFYAFQGFEVLGYSAEETIDPKKNVPRSIVTSLTIVTFLYLSVAVSFTLMVPYEFIDTTAPFPSAFKYNNVAWAKYIVEIGPILALTNLCILEMYTIQRLTYSVATDGLLFSFLARVSGSSRVPIRPVIVFGPIVICLILVIDLSNLIGFMVLFTFIQYSLLIAYLIILRYKVTDDSDSQAKKKHSKTLAKNKAKNSLWSCCKYILLSVKSLVITLYVCLFIMSIMIVVRGHNLMQGHVMEVSTVTVLGLIVMASLIILCRREKNYDPNVFQVRILFPLFTFLEISSSSSFFVIIIIFIIRPICKIWCTT